MVEIEFNKDGSVSRKRLHSGNLPSIPRTEECHVCSAKFTRLNHLKRHLLTHTDSRKHECERCHFQFTRRDLLTKHLRICGKPKIRFPKSRRKSCAPCALAKCKCDLQQPCSCCIAKKKECTFTDTKSVIAVKVIPADIPETECTPSASSSITFTPDALVPSNFKSRAAEKHLEDRHPLDVSSDLCFAPPLDLTIANENWLDDTGQFIDQFNSSCLQDIFFDWNVPPGCSPLDFPSTFSPIYAPAETTPLGIIPDSTHILTPSAYLEPAHAQQSAGEFKRYFEIAMKTYTTYLPILHSTWRKDGKSPVLLAVMQAMGGSRVRSREAQEFLHFVIEDITPVLTREINRSASDPGYQTQLLAAYLFLLIHPVFQIPTNKPVPCIRLVPVSEAIKEMIYRKDLISDVVTWKYLTTYPLTASAIQNEWVKWAEYESRKRLLWTLYCFDAMQVLYFGGRSTFHISYLPIPLPSESSVWFADTATTWLDTLTSDSQYGQFPERLVGASIVDKLRALQGDWDAPLPLNVWQLTCMVIAIAVEIESCLYQRHKVETETRYLFHGLPGPTQITLFGDDMPTSTVRKMLQNWIDSYSNCTEIFYEGSEKVICAFNDIIHLWYISHVFLNMYEKPTNEFKYAGTRTANAAKEWLSKNLPRGDKGHFIGTMENIRFQSMDYESQEDEC
ncbi:hypothetical protein BDM02DRAFT_3120649 [Thelephora ganbajun]|uniref:Uncharacterized protein n=1 Tax=Thelephora ganbajun TaxID=370292 RepID=A0ACB6Z6K6_THEGA|nr:hypothetical protein BDM02DRAFT_3120649 [Thelephora ganbajun]